MVTRIVRVPNIMLPSGLYIIGQVHLYYTLRSPIDVIISEQSLYTVGGLATIGSSLWTCTQCMYNIYLSPFYTHNATRSTRGFSQFGDVFVFRRLSSSTSPLSECGAAPREGSRTADMQRGQFHPIVYHPHMVQLVVVHKRITIITSQPMYITSHIYICIKYIYKYIMRMYTIHIAHTD